MESFYFKSSKSSPMVSKVAKSLNRNTFEEAIRSEIANVISKVAKVKETEVVTFKEV